MKKRLRELLAWFNVWHWLRLPSLGDVRSLLDASSETIRRQRELEDSIVRLSKRLDEFQSAFKSCSTRYDEDIMEIKSSFERLERQNNLAQETAHSALQAESAALLLALQTGDSAVQKALQTNRETVLDSLQTCKKTFASGLQFLEKTVKEKAASLEKIHDEIVSSQKSVSSAIGKYEVLSGHMKEAYETVTELIAKSTNDSVSANREFRAQLKKCVDEFTEQKKIHFAIEQHCAEVERHCGQVELRCAETEQLSAELMNYLRLLILESITNDVSDVVKKKESNSNRYSSKTRTI